VSEFFEAVTKGRTEVVETMLKKEPALASSKNNQGISAVLLAAYNGHRELGRLLVRYGAKLDIFEASAIDELDRVKELIGGSPELLGAFSPDGFTPLHLAAFFGNTDVAKYLVTRGAAVNAVSRNRKFAVSNTPLEAAAAAQQVNMVRLLLKLGADPNARSGGGMTPLHEAAGNGNMEIVKLLLSAGASVRAKSDSGKTPAELASERRHEDVADYLRRQP